MEKLRCYERRIPSSSLGWTAISIGSSYSGIILVSKTKDGCSIHSDPAISMGELSILE